MVLSDMMTKAAVAAFERVVAWAARDKLAYATTDMFAAELLADEAVRSVCTGLGADCARLEADIRAAVEAQTEYNKLGEGRSMTLTKKAGEAVARAALRVESGSVHHKLTALQFLIEMLEAGDGVARGAFEQQGVTLLGLKKAASAEKAEPIEAAPDPAMAEMAAGVLGEAAAGPAEEDKTCGGLVVDLIEKARSGGLDPLIGRGGEIERLEQILVRRRKNNALLVGDAGVGKTAVALGLAQKIASGDVPAVLKDVPFLALDAGALLAGTSYKGMFEARVRRLQVFLEKAGSPILLVDDIGQLLSRGAEDNSPEAFKPLLASGAARCIGTATFEDAKRIDGQRALARLFEKVEVPELSEQQSVEVLRGAVAGYEAHHRVRYAPEAIEGAVELTARFMRDRRLPDKAIDMLDEAGAAARLAARPEGFLVDRPQIERVVSRAARVPTSEITRQDTDRLRTLPQALRSTVFGQDKAVDEIVAAIRLSRSGLGDERRPIGAFLFAGPTGTGKTEMARQLAKALGIGLIRFDMSEYMESHSVSRLIGSPPGYVGYDKGGLLTDEVRRTPHAVLLLDEVEKAHPDILNVLLQVMDHGTLTDNQGQQASFRNIILIMTSNAGGDDLSRARIGFAAGTETGDATGAIRRCFRPEFRNRLDAIVMFEALPRPIVRRVADKFLAELASKLAARGVQAEFDGALVDHLVDRGFDPVMGARPMQRLIAQEVRRPLAEELLFGSLSKGGAVRIGWDGSRVTLAPH